MSHLFPTYGRFDITIKSTKGTKIRDVNDREYLDFGSGIGVCNLGHNAPVVKSAIEEQLERYWHVSNLYKQPIQEEVAKLLTDNTCGDFVFFANSEIGRASCRE